MAKNQLLADIGESASEPVRTKNPESRTLAADVSKKTAADVATLLMDVRRKDAESGGKELEDKIAFIHQAVKTLSPERGRLQLEIPFR